MDRPSAPRSVAPGDATLDAPLSIDTSGVASKRPAVHLVEGSGGDSAFDTQCVLRCRLRAASLMLFGGFAVFLIWYVIEGSLFSEPVGLVLLASHLLVTAVLGISGLSLCRKCTISTRILRLKELLIFGLPAVYFVFMQSISLMHSATNDQLLAPISPPWLVLIFTYALFIPNTWRKAASVIAVLVAMPIVMDVLLTAYHPACNNLLAGATTHHTRLVLLLSVCGVSAVVGVHTINTLRREAFAAKQLGQYKLREMIGAGGMGEVYLAEHQLMKRPCAIKVIRPEKAGDPKILARFEREVKAIAKLSHWNSVYIYDYGRADDGTFYYVMEFLPGMNLFELVERFGPLPPERVIHLLGQTCEALSEAHEAGLMHRDIKPANIFAAHRGGVYDVAKLLDFGLAKPLAEPQDTQLTLQGSITGSPLFMSPEQATNEDAIDGRSDIYSLGAVAYFLLTGKPPFEETNPLKVLIAHAHQDLVPPSQHRSDIPDDLEQIVLRCMAKKPEDRFQTAAELAKAFDDCRDAGRWTRQQAAAWWRENAFQREGKLETAGL